MHQITRIEFQKCISQLLGGTPPSDNPHFLFNGQRFIIVLAKASKQERWGNRPLGPGGYSDLVWTGGVPLKPRNPYRFLRVNLLKKIPILRDFSQNICPFFKNTGVRGEHPKILEILKKMDPRLRLFL